jgi:hypothetical protein
MAKVGLQGPGIDAVIRQLETTSMSQHVGCTLISRPLAARSIMRRKPETVNGEPRSLTNKNGDAAFRCNRRKDRSSAPVNGCVLGVPAFYPTDV